MRTWGNLILLLLVVVAAAVLFVMACPWFESIGHKGLCYFCYAILIVVLLWARGESVRQQRSRAIRR